MRFRVDGVEAIPDLGRGTEEDIARAVTDTIRQGAEAVKADWRAQIEAARLGPKLARTVRSQVYPVAQTSIDAAALIWTKAPKIIDSYARGATILPVNGVKFLWIPTDSVPRKRQGNALTPREVEAKFGRQLTIISPGSGGLRSSPSRITKAVAYAGFRNLAIRRSSGRYRNASLKELTPGSRSYRETAKAFVVMFTLVPRVRVSQRLDLDAIARAAEGRYAGLLSKNWR